MRTQAGQAELDGRLDRGDPVGAGDLDDEGAALAPGQPARHRARQRVPHEHDG